MGGWKQTRPRETWRFWNCFATRQEYIDFWSHQSRIRDASSFVLLSYRFSSFSSSVFSSKSAQIGT